MNRDNNQETKIAICEKFEKELKGQNGPKWLILVVINRKAYKIQVV